MAARAHPSLTFQNLTELSLHRNILPSDGENVRYTYKARGAIFLYLRSLRTERKEVLIPSYHCPTMVYAIERAGFVPRYYGVREDLSIDIDSLKSTLGSNTAIVLVINYFGFSASIDAVRALSQEQGALVLEDCSHSFLQANPTKLAGGRGSASVYALWKLIPSGVGGMALLNVQSEPIAKPKGGISHKAWLRHIKHLAEQVIASILLHSKSTEKNKKSSGQTRWEPNLLQASMGDATLEEIYRQYPNVTEDFESRIPALQKFILRHTKLDKVVDARRRNYRVLQDALHGCGRAKSLFDTLPDAVVPWCFPLRIKHRRKFDFRMRELGVPLFTFGEKLHPSLFADEGLSEELKSIARSLRDSILCIGIHQNLDVGVLQAAGRAIAEVLNEPNRR